MNYMELYFAIKIWLGFIGLIGLALYAILVLLPIWWEHRK